MVHGTVSAIERRSVLAYGGVPIKMDIKLTSHMAVAMCMRYVHKEDKPAWDAAALVATQLFHGKRLISMPDTGIAAEKLPDIALCKAVQEMESGLIDVDLGGALYKKRVARPGGGKSGGYRSLLSARIGSRYVFLHGFSKSEKGNITQDEKKALQLTCYWRCIVSKIIESLRGDLATLQEAGAIDKVTMREFDAICPPPVREFDAVDIKRLREGLKFSQPVFALYLHTTASTIRKWEQDMAIRAYAHTSLLGQKGGGGEQAIAQIRLGGQAQTRYGTAAGNLLALLLVDMGGVNQAPAFIHIEVVVQIGNRAAALDVPAGQHFGHLLGNVDVDRVARGQAVQAVDQGIDGTDIGGTQGVGRNTVTPVCIQGMAVVQGLQQHGQHGNGQPAGAGCFHDTLGQQANGRVILTVALHLYIEPLGNGLHVLGLQAGSETVHQVAPAPETVLALPAKLGQPGHGTLKGM
uniref:HTH cro/C1-type domain-containing protein n=1 Tax=Steinernema glaseri TaxID=37863 RepID=A0A1I7YH48_9BILA